MTDLAEMQAMAVLRETETEIQEWGTDYSCSRQLQRERGSEALAPSKYMRTGIEMTMTTCEKRKQSY